MGRPIYINPIVKKGLIIFGVELIPTVLGLVFSFVFENFVILETSYAILAVLLLLFAMARSWNRDSNNFRKNKTVVEDKKTDSYKEYRNFQLTLWILGIVNFLISHLIFVFVVK